MAVTVTVFQETCIELNCTKVQLDDESDEHACGDDAELCISTIQFNACFLKYCDCDCHEDCIDRRNCTPVGEHEVLPALDGADYADDVHGDGDNQAEDQQADGNDLRVDAKDDLIDAHFVDANDDDVGQEDGED